MQMIPNLYIPSILVVSIKLPIKSIWISRISPIIVKGIVSE
nr:unnamed protein product [Callosobruchus chinensis]